MDNKKLMEHVVNVAKKHLDWGLTNNMRAITVGVKNSKQLIFRAYINNPITINSDTDSLSDMGVYVWSMVSDNFENQWSECVPTQAPLKELENLGAWVYIRDSEDKRGVLL